MRVIVTKHAKNRYFQYTGQEVNNYKLRTRLKIKLASGAKMVNKRIFFSVDSSLIAVCAPIVSGWLVITFLRK